MTPDPKNPQPGDTFRFRHAHERDKFATYTVTARNGDLIDVYCPADEYRSCWHVTAVLLDVPVPR